MPRLTVIGDPAWEHRPDRDGTGIVDVPHPEPSVRARFARPGPFPVHALRWSAAPLPTAGGGDGSLAFELTEHVGWLADAADRADPADVVKQVSFLHASDTVTPDEFRDHYRHHVEVAQRHMPSLWQYVQYDVTRIDALDAADGRAGTARGIVAVSVLWFRSTDDFLHRYFASPDDEKAFRSQEGFLDLSKAFTFVGTSHPSAAPTARP